MADMPVGCAVSIGGAFCDQPRESTWEGACVHEHVVTDIGICAGHLYVMESPVTCTPCSRDRAGTVEVPGHACKVQLREAVRQ